MRRRGFLLVLSLFLCLLVVIIGLAYLAVKQGEYAAGQAVVAHAQAKNIARAGMEDLKAKLSKDEFFPTGVGDEQLVFSYSEEITAISDPSLSGSYRITVDRTHKADDILVLVSVGTVGPVEHPRGRYSVYAELDITSYRFKVWKEGSLPRR